MQFIKIKVFIIFSFFNCTNAVSADTTKNRGNLVDIYFNSIKYEEIENSIDKKEFNKQSAQKQVKTAIMAISNYSNLEDLKNARNQGYHFQRVAAGSMMNTIRTGDFLLADITAYKNYNPERFDIAMVENLKDPEIRYVKRIIGLPNENVKLLDGKVYIDDVEIEEDYISQEFNKNHLNSEYNIPNDSYFVLGDNRDNSYDSRHYGVIPKNKLHSKVKTIWFSIDRMLGIKDDRLGKVIR